MLELKSTTAGDAIKNLAINNKLIYKDISLVPKTINWNNQAGDIEIDLKILNKTLKEFNNVVIYSKKVYKL